MRRWLPSPRVCTLALSLVSLGGCAGGSDKGGDGGGDEGADGSDGTDGSDGADGTDGADGSDGTDGADGSDGADGTDGAGCTTGLLSTTPADGTTDVDVETTVRAELNEADPTAVLKLFERGVEVEGALAWEGATLVFTPAAPLAEVTELTAAVSWCNAEGGESWGFTTRSASSPVAVDLTGQAWAIDLATATWTAPVGVGETLATAFNLPLLLGVSADAGDTLTLQGAVPDAGLAAQDLCRATQPFGEADFSTDPRFLTASRSVTLPGDSTAFADEVPLPLEEFVLGGVIDADGQAFHDGAMTFSVDMRLAGAAVEGLVSTSDPDEICDFTALFSIPCVACGSDAAAYCIDFEIEGVTGAAFAGGALEAVLADDCHPDCPASFSNPDCDTTGW